MFPVISAAISKFESSKSIRCFPWRLARGTRYVIRYSDFRAPGLPYSRLSYPRERIPDSSDIASKKNKYESKLSSLFLPIGCDWTSEKKFNRILIATDGSKAAKYAAKRGIELAAAVAAEVEFIYVLEDLSYALPISNWQDLEYPMNLIKDAATKGANKAIDHLGEIGTALGVKTSRKIVSGDPAKIIVEEAKNYDLLVLGTFGRSEIVEYLMGGVANKILKKVSCPVFLVRYPADKIKKRKLADE